MVAIGFRECSITNPSPVAPSSFEWYSIAKSSPAASVVAFTNSAFDKYKNANKTIRAYLARNDDSVDMMNQFTFGFTRMAKDVLIETDDDRVLWCRFVYTANAEDVRSLEMDYLVMRPALEVRYEKKVCPKFVTLVDNKHGRKVLYLLRESSLTKRRGLVEVVLYDADIDELVHMPFEETPAYSDNEAVTPCSCHTGCRE